MALWRKLKHFVFLPLTVALLSGSVVHARPLAKVSLIQDSGLSEISNAEFRKSLSETHGLKPLSLKDYPELKGVPEKLEKLLQKLVLPKDGDGPIRLLLSDSFEVNAMFARFPGSNERVVIVNAGLLDFVQSDDELAFVLGHELEHGSSEIEAALDLKKKARTEEASLQETVTESLTAKSIENEVDLKSAVNRVHEKGMNANEARKFLIRLRERTGDRYSDSHTMLGTRINTLDSGTTLLTRGAGEKIQTVNSYDIVNSKIHQAFTSERSKRLQLKKVQAILDAPTPEFEKAFLEVMDPALHEGPTVLRNHFQLQFGSVHEKLFSDRSRAIHRALSSAFSEEDRLDQLLRLQEKLTQNLTQARNRILTPKVLEQMSALQVKAWWNLENPRNFGVLKDSSGNPYLLKYINGKHDLDFKIADLRAVKSAATESQIKALELQRQKFILSIQKYRSAYEPGKETDALIERFAKVARVKGDRVYGFIKKNDFFYALDQKANHGSSSFNEIETFKADYAAKNGRRLGASLMAPEFLSTEEQSAFFRQKFWAGSRANTEQFSADLAAGYMEKWVPEFKSASPQKQIQLAEDAVVVLSNGFPRDVGTIKDAIRANRNQPVRRAVDQFLKSLAEDAKSYEVSQAGYQSILIDKPGTKPAPHLDGFNLDAQPVSRVGRSQSLYLQWGPESARMFLDSPSGQAYFQKRFQLLSEELKKFPDRYTVLRDLDADLDSYRNLLQSIPGTKIAKDPQTTQAIDDLLAAASRKLIGKESTPATEAWVKDLLLTRYHDDIWREGAIGTPRAISATQLMEAARTELKANPELRAGLEKVVRFDGLMKGATLSERESIYRFASEFPDLLRGDSTDLLRLTGQDLKTYYDRRVAFLNWSVNQAPASRKAAVDAFLERPGVTINEREEYFGRKEIAAEFNEQVTRAELKTFKSDLMPSRYRDFLERIRLSGLSAIDVAPAIGKGGLSFAERIALVRANADALLVHTPRGHLFTHLKIKASFDLAERRKSSQTLMDELHISPEKAARLPLKERTLVLDTALKSELKTPEVDALFHDVFKQIKAGLNPGIDLSDESLVQKLYYEGSKVDLAQWQLEKKYGLSELGKKGRTDNLTRDHFRPVLDDIKNSIEKQYPELSPQRDALINFVEAKVTTTRKENELFKPLRVNESNWASSTKLALLDAPTTITSAIKNDFDRLEMLKYLTHQQDEIPKFVLDIVKRVNSGKSNVHSQLAVQVKELKQRFTEADIYSRNFLLMPLLDEEKGALADPAARSQITSMILGTHADNDLYQALFEAYIQSVPVSQKKVVYGQILASLVESAGKGGASIRTILEAMGPLGIKAGQFIRTSGLAKPEIAKELDGFLDRADEPIRKKILDDVEKVFGEQLDRIISIGELKGSGSINYAVRVKLKDPDGKSVEALISVQRDAVEGKVGNENDIWKDAIERLKKNPNEDAKKLAQLVEEARINAYDTLKPGGLELDHGIQRANYGDAQAIYGKTAEETASGFRIEAVRPLKAYQDLIPESLQAKYSVYEYVSSTSWNQMKDVDLRAKLAKDVVKSELQAIRAARFDRDGHTGNWLIDEDGQRLVRIDYPQLERFPQNEIDEFLNSLKLVANPWITPLDAKPLAKSLEKVFSITGAAQKIDSKWIQTILSSKQFPKGNPQERLFFIRQELETLLQKKTATEVAVRLSQTSRSALMSFSKIVSYQEYMAPGDFRRLVADQLGFDGSEIAMAQLKRPVGAALKAWNSCEHGAEQILKALFP